MRFQQEMHHWTELVVLSNDWPLLADKCLITNAVAITGLLLCNEPCTQASVEPVGWRVVVYPACFTDQDDQPQVTTGPLVDSGSASESPWQVGKALEFFGLSRCLW